MSISRHHVEWLSLLEISGPFLSMPVLMQAFPNGLDKPDRDLTHETRAAYEAWTANQQLRRPDPSIHTAWVRYVLRIALEMPGEAWAEGQAIPETIKATIPEHRDVVRPDLMLVDPTTGAPRLLIQVYPSSQGLEKPLPKRPASPVTRTMELLYATGVRLGLLTNGEQWILVHAQRGEATTTVGWYAALWPEEPLTWRAFYSLIGARIIGVPAEHTLEALLDRSAKDQHEVTDQLGYQVRRAVEILVQAIDRADQDRGGALLSGTDEETLYEAALTVMMRLVVLLSAEERGLFLLGDPLYDQHYAASTLMAQQREMADQAGEEVLERRYDAWSRLLATFRAVHGGVQHEDLRLPAYGGSLFDPDRFPFLEGRSAGTSWRKTAAHTLPIDNRTVLHLLEALQVLQVKVPGGGPAEARRLSFRALDIEQIGHVYEGLLDHHAVRAAEPVLGLTGARDSEPEIALAALEAQAARPDQVLLDYIRNQTARTPNAIKNGLKAKPDPLRAERLAAACGNDEALARRVLPWAGLVRDDGFGFPVVIRAGSVYVTAGTERRSSGTHYTPRILTEPIVQHTLEPLVYIGPAEGLPRERWQLRSPAEILALKVCDKAVGSGAFLVQADRYLAERLFEAWEETESGGWRVEGREASGKDKATGRRILITVEGERADDLNKAIPVDPDDRMILARRLVAERCLYGVDKNPLAVEMAKLSLWLVTMAKDRPFDYLDHALKCGDSLVGVDEEQFLRWSQTLKGTIGPLYFEKNQEALALARQKRQQLRSIVVNDVRDAEEKERLLAEANAAVERVKRGCDLLVGVDLVEGLNDAERETWRAELLIEHTAKETLTSDKAQRALAAAAKHRAFHWFLEFPEVFERAGVAANPGFHGFVGNPPFIGGRRIRETLGDDYRDALYRLYSGSSGNADYCAFFFLRAFWHLRRGGTLGLIATNTIAQGDTRRTGLEKILAKGGTIYNADNNRFWPGTAAVTVNVVHVARGPMQKPFLLDGEQVQFISAMLDSKTSVGEPVPLFANANKSFQGSVVVGLGFVLTQEEARRLLDTEPHNRDVIFPYLNGEDLNTSPDQSPSRWVINFFDWPLEKAQVYTAPMAIIRERVQPVRAAVRREAHRRYWWHYGDKRPALYRAIEALDRVLVVARVTKYLAFAFVPNGLVYNEKTFVFAFTESRYFTVLQSNLHEVWAWRYSSTMRNAGINYAPSDCFENFAFPGFETSGRSLDALGETYHEHRRQIMLARQEGLTATYNRFHNPDVRAADIARLRELHVEMDRAVAAAYGWADLDLGHGFHETAQGLRFTIDEAARREVLGRLLELNHQRYAEEVAMGLHEAWTTKARSSAKSQIAKTGGETEAEDGGQLRLL